MPAIFQQTPEAPPAAPSAPAPNVVSSSALPGAALTRQDIAVLRSRRSEISNQLESAAGRRRELADQLRRAEGTNKAGLEARIAVLDDRIVRLEGDLDQTGQLLTTAQAAQVSSTAQRWEGRGPDFARVDPEPILLAITIFVISPIAFSISRLIWRRGSRQAPSAGIPSDSAQRLVRIEQAMDAIAIEVERVSEGQRFVTRVLSERGGVALGAGQQPAEPVRVPLSDASRVR